MCYLIHGFDDDDDDDDDDNNNNGFLIIFRCPHSLVGELFIPK